MISGNFTFLFCWISGYYYYGDGGTDGEKDIADPDMKAF